MSASLVESDRRHERAVCQTGHHGAPGTSGVLQGGRGYCPCSCAAAHRCRKNARAGGRLPVHAAAHSLPLPFVDCWQRACLSLSPSSPRVCARASAAPIRATRCALLFMLTAPAVAERLVWALPCSGIMPSPHHPVHAPATEPLLDELELLWSPLQGGSPVPPEGQESPGCPLYSHPAHLTDNKDCVLCECCPCCVGVACCAHIVTHCVGFGVSPAQRAAAADAG